MIRKILFLAALLAVVLPASAQRMRRSELSVSYGAIPSTNWMNPYTGLLDGFYNNAASNISGWGAVTAGYDFRVIAGLHLGAQVVYSSNEESYNTIDVTVKNRYWAVMPTVKMTWLNLKVVSLYSRVGIGLSFAKSKSGDNSVTQTQFAFQASAIGVETAGRIGFYAEAGLGQSGSLLLGGRWRF